MDWNFLISNKDELIVTTDSRRVTPGCIFVALRGEHFDGNDFVDAARAAGAAHIIAGDNALAELQDLARSWRRHLGLPVLGITGTNGKTTTKELTAAVLRQRFGDRVHYTEGNLNNQLGVPLTLLQLTRQHEFAIIEMGASHPGDIRELVNIAEPDYGLITNVGRAHLQGFGSLEGVMATKRELYEYIALHGGTVFRNVDNPVLERMAVEAYNNPLAAHRGEVVYHTGTMLPDTHLVGDYNSENIQAALSVGEYFGVSRAQGEAAIRAYVPTNNRSQLMQTERNTLVVDAYNANPTSMMASINAFHGNAYILGSMRELGSYSHFEHQNIANMLLERKADTVLLVGDEWRETTAPYPIFADVAELRAHLEQHPLSGLHILVKGSRSNRLEALLPLL